MADSQEAPLPKPPSVPTLMSWLVPLTKSRRKMSVALFVSPSMMSLAALSNSANWPLVESAVGMESPVPGPVPLKLMLTSTVVPLVRSRRNTFILGGTWFRNGLLVPLKTRLFARLANRTKRPSGVMIGRQESPPAPAGGVEAESTAETSCSGAAGDERATQRAKMKKTAVRRIEKTFFISVFQVNDQGSQTDSTMPASCPPGQGRVPKECLIDMRTSEP